MRTSLNDIRLTEQYLLKQLSPEDALLFKAKLLINPVLRLNMLFQKKVYLLVAMYHRKKLKEETQTVHQRIFEDPAKKVFQQNIYNLFNK